MTARGYQLFATILLLPFALVALAACGGTTPTTAGPRPTETNMSKPATGVEKTLYIGPMLRDCVGVGPMKCLMAREDPTAPWQHFYSQIEGFTFEPGYTYTLRVRVTDVLTPIPADASSKRYTLIEVVSKTPAPTVAPAATMGGTSWTLAEMSGKPPISSPKPVTMQFDAEGRVAGSAGCNQYSASYTEDAGQLRVGQARSTRIACMQPGVMEQEAAFLKALSAAATVTRDGDRLQVTTADGVRLVFTKS
ncbi:MAG: META domain-containing protein [Anaerolineae bacterium]